MINPYHDHHAPDKNVVRDRTLVLRVLVPGLHTSLHDKINANKAASAASASSSSSTDASSLLLSGSMSGGGGGGGEHHQILNLEGVSCIPSSKGSTLWHFRCDGATYPARLVNLPWYVVVSFHIGEIVVQFPYICCFHHRHIYYGMCSNFTIINVH